MNLLQAGAQCFPLYLYEPVEETPPEGDLFQQAGEEQPKKRYKKEPAITKEGMAYFQKAWPKAVFQEEDVFYYIYGLLHAPEYRSRYANSLSTELPRIPCVKEENDFWTFSKAGRALAELHSGYEKVEPHFALDDEVHLRINNKSGLSEHVLYHLEKMSFGKTRDEDGKSALEWVMDRQQIKTDKRSGIVNDPNDWALEHENDPRWPLLLFLKVMTVSLRTKEIVDRLPGME